MPSRDTGPSSASVRAGITLAYGPARVPTSNPGAAILAGQKNGNDCSQKG